MGLYKKVKGEKEPDKEESFILIEHEHAFGWAYRSYTINGSSSLFPSPHFPKREKSGLLNNFQKLVHA